MIQTTTVDPGTAFGGLMVVEKLDYGMVVGRDNIVDAHETFFSIFPDTRLTQTVLSARMARPCPSPPPEPRCL